MVFFGGLEKCDFRYKTIKKLLWHGLTLESQTGEVCDSSYFAISCWKTVSFLPPPLPLAAPKANEFFGAHGDHVLFFRHPFAESSRLAAPLNLNL